MHPLLCSTPSKCCPECAIDTASVMWCNLIHEAHCSFLKVIIQFCRCILQVTSTEVVLAAKCKKKYANAHVYHVNSIALSSDQETFITADDLRINLWHLDIEDQAFNVVDMKPPNMEELTEVGNSFLNQKTCNGMRDEQASNRSLWSVV